MQSVNCQQSLSLRYYKQESILRQNLILEAFYLLIFSILQAQKDEHFTCFPSHGWVFFVESCDDFYLFS